MQKYNKLFSLFFLGIFGMFMLHQLLPHVHHEHEGLEDSASLQEDHHHDHDTGHHHDDEEDKDFDFLAFLLANHAHSVQEVNIQATKHVVIQQVVSKDTFHDALSDFQPLITRSFGIQKVEFGHVPPDLLNYLYLSASFLRGPPVLG